MFLINLNEIPPEGKAYICNNNTGELNEILKDLIAKTPFSSEFYIKPMDSQGTFELNGFIKTELPEQCSRCGLDFKMATHEKFSEILMPHLETPRNAKYSRVNHFSDLSHEGPEVAEYQGTTFNMGEFLHEVLALSEPLTPAPPPDAEDNCSLCKISLKNHDFSFDETMEIKNTPFEALKGIKID